MVIHSVPAFLLGKVNGPLKVAPASNRIVSPGFARSIASWRSSPSFTRRTRPVDETSVVSTYSSGGSGATVFCCFCTDGAAAHPSEGTTNGNRIPAAITNVYMVDSSFYRPRMSPSDPLIHPIGRFALDDAGQINHNGPRQRLFQRA